MKQVSIIIPAYNAAETIHRCLEAVLHLDYPDALLEIIVVNDGSEDNTPALIRAIDSPRIKIITNETNRGRAFSRLRGAGESFYDHLLFIDSRVIIDRGALVALEKSDAEVQSPLAIGRTNSLWDSAFNSLRKLAFRKFYQNQSTTYIDLYNFDVTPKGTGALFIPKDLFIRTTMSIDYESQHVSDDTKLLYCLVQGGHRIYLNPDFIITYLQRSGLWENVVHLYQRGPKFIDYYYGKHTTYTVLINLSLLFVSCLAGLLCLGTITVLMGLLILLFFNGCFTAVAGKSMRERWMLFVVFPVIALSFGCGIIKGLWIKWKKKLA